MWFMALSALSMAAFTLQVLMTNSDFVTISNFLDDVLTFLLKVTRIRCVHFTLHLVKQTKNSIYDITNQLSLIY